jgi:hypothetical protein
MGPNTLGREDSLTSRSKSKERCPRIGPHRTAVGPVPSKASRCSRASLELVDPFTDECVQADR